MPFEPIAIVAQACVLPGALTPSELWSNVLDERNCLSRVPAGRWGLPRAAVMGTVDDAADRTWTDVGGYVSGFESVFDPGGFLLPAEEIATLDPLFQWVMHSAREALRSVGHERASIRAGLVLGGLAFPTSTMARYAESVWLEAQRDTFGGPRALQRAGMVRPHARNRFCSGLPALLTARALGLGAGSFALDAACASSLYAIKLACDRLHDGSADLMIAGGVSRTDDLFTHIGFCALGAMSRTGRSRPFHCQADGLVPAEGAGFVVLQRLPDAVAAGRRILGVIRAIGLSNDGRGRGLLAPAEEGQERAMRLAYAECGIAPRDVGLVECHATGTLLGDASEVRAMARVFADCEAVPIGSLKSNLGHLVAAAGAAGLIKVLSALEHGRRPATLHADAPIAALDATPFRLLHETESWSGPRRAAISAFGFGGNNAHLIVEAWEGSQSVSPTGALPGIPSLHAGKREEPSPAIAIVAIGSRVGDGQNTLDFARALFSGRTHREPRAFVAVALKDLKFPPHDLAKALPQQTLVLEAAREAAKGIRLPRDRTAVLIGMGCDPELARYGARWMLGAWSEKWAAGERVDDQWLEQAGAQFQQPLDAAGVLGAMPNITANRISSQLDLAGPSFSVAAEEASGIRALELAARALRQGEIDAALVGAVDLSHEVVHRTALNELGRTRPPGDAAIVLVLKRYDDALRDGDEIYALLDDRLDEEALKLGDVEPGAMDLAIVFGHAHAANGLLHLAAGALGLRSRMKPQAGAPAQEWPEARNVRISISVLEAEPISVSLRSDPALYPENKPTWLAEHSASAAVTQPKDSDLRLPAHLAGPRLPAFESTVQVMERAPTLASAIEEGVGPLHVGRTHTSVLENPQSAHGTLRPSTNETNHNPSKSRLPLPAVANRAVECPEPGPSHSAFTASVIAKITAQQKRIGELHREFVTQQTATHQKFLRLRQEQQAVLLHNCGAIAGAAFNLALPGNLVTDEAPAAMVAAPPADPRTTAPQFNGKPIFLHPSLPGPQYGRAQLEELAGGKISSIFGPLFAAQDAYHRQVRMPEPPLLLADRVTGIDAAPGSMETGTIWTETDVRLDSWHLDPTGRMPAGIMIEAGQADLLLISWLGVDLVNRGERVYRLLGCELTFLGGLCEPGDTLAFDIHIDSHANQGDVRLFFFHYDCRVNGALRFRVRHGQAGFFTDGELRNSAGVLWTCEPSQLNDQPQVDPPVVICQRRAFDRAALRAYAAGDAFHCFGPGWEPTQAHVRTPRIAGGRMLFLDEVTEFDPRGGPWRCGYLRAETSLAPDDWFFAGHFKNDPCMPGTLMFEGCLQAMAFYLAAMGFTVDRDGWAFEPVPEQTYVMRCRGQVTPASSQLVYEVFVSEVVAAPLPTVFADLLCTVDNLKIFHAHRVGLRLRPDWPLEHWRQLGPAFVQQTGNPVPLQMLGGLRGFIESRPPASVEGFAFGYASLLACAWGRPMAAFGPSYALFEGPRRVPRLPGPPYHFISRVSQINGPMGAMQPGSTVEVEYDVPRECWYFNQNGHPTMPLAVLMEAALQPCGWLSLYVGSAFSGSGDLLFRNLDGALKLTGEVMPLSGALRTKVKLLTVSQTQEMTIESFHVEGFLGEQLIYEMKSVCGIFPPQAFANQVGLAVSLEEQARLEAESYFHIDLTQRSPRFFQGNLRLAGPMLLMLDRITGYWPEGGRAGLGYLRAEKDVDPAEWFFKAHFFQDPVQPGSLGMEAMCQLLQFHIIESGMASGVETPRFEPLMLDRQVTWKFRGQVIPANCKITIEMEIVASGADGRGTFAVADAWLWVDGKRIYQAQGIGMRVRSAADPKPKLPRHDAEFLLDPAVDIWLEDHRPTWTFPVLPMMSMVDSMAAAAANHAGRQVAVLRDVQIRRWVPFSEGAVRFCTRVAGSTADEEQNVTLFAWREAGDPALSRFEAVAEARAAFTDSQQPPPAFEPLKDTVPIPNPYGAGSLFHGPSFHYLIELRLGSTGSSGILSTEQGTVPRGYLHQGILDAATHAIPHDTLWQWSAEIPRGHASYPYRIPEMHFYAPLPDSGHIQIETRFAGFEGGPRFPAVEIQLLAVGEVLVVFRLVLVLHPKGNIGGAKPEARLAFLRDKQYVAGLALSRFDGETTTLTEAEVRQSDWLPGNLAFIYSIPLERRTRMTAEIAVREHVASRLQVHPSAIVVGADLTNASATTRPLFRQPLNVSSSRDTVSVRNAGPAIQDLTQVRSYWRERMGVGPWPIEDLYFGLIERFVGDVVIADPEAFAAARGRSCLYVANHQVAIESLLFSVLISALSAAPAVTLAKAEHRTSWLGWLIAHTAAYPGVNDPKLIAFFEREDRESLVKIVAELAEQMRSGNRSAMVHVEGTRSLACRRPVVKMSSTFIDMALAVDAPIIPVRFIGGLPAEELAKRLEFPVGLGRQDYWIGCPILPKQLAALPYKERKEVVISAMNDLGPDLLMEMPAAPDPTFAAAVEDWMTRTGATLEDAVFFATLAASPSPQEGIRTICEAARNGHLVVGTTARGAWLGRWAERLYGPRGPQVVWTKD